MSNERRKMKKLLLLIIPLFLISRATTKISSFVNPDIDISNYKSILVLEISEILKFVKLSKVILYLYF